MDISPELVERMVLLVRVLADVPKDSALGQSGYASEARAIVAILPKPVDPDLIEARKMAAKIYCQGPDELIPDILAGRHDETHEYDIRHFLAAIKRGRELQKAEGSK